MSYIKGVPYIILWFSSIFAGYALLFCPLAPLLVCSNKYYRRVTDFIITFWQIYAAALLTFIYGCEVHVTGDPINAEEYTLLVMNHRTRTDWSYLWPAVSKATFGRNKWMYPTKFVLKDSIRHVPGVGWMMSLGSYIYIKRNWEEDQAIMSKAIKYFSELDSRFSLLIFPEGTDLTPHTKAKSDKFADKMGLPHYQHVLHPRTTGFCFLAREMLRRNCLDAIYDVTIIYVDKVPQNEKSLVNGNIPKNVCVHFKKYTPSQFGFSEKSLQTFLEARWAEKEHTIASFYRSGRKTLYDTKLDINPALYKCDLVLAFAFWTLLPIPAAYLLYTSSYFRMDVVAATVHILLTNFICDGFQIIEIEIHEIKRRLWRLFFFEPDEEEYDSDE